VKYLLISFLVAEVNNNKSINATTKQANNRQVRNHTSNTAKAIKRSLKSKLEASSSVSK